MKIKNRNANSTAYSDTRPVRTCWVCINSHSSKVCNGISVSSLPNENRVCGILFKAFTVTQSMELSVAQKSWLHSLKPQFLLSLCWWHQKTSKHNLPTFANIYLFAQTLFNAPWVSKMVPFPRDCFHGLFCSSINHVNLDLICKLNIVISGFFFPVLVSTGIFFWYHLPF